MRKTHVLPGLFPIFLGLAVAASAPTASRGEEPTKPIAVGDKTPNSHSLRDPRGNLRSLSSFKDAKAVVVVFLGVDCPVANLYLPRLLELEKQYRAKQVQFLGVYANEAEDLEQIAGHASDHDLPFPVLKDCRQKLADLAGVGRLSTVLVLDGDGVLRYRGRIDDRYGVAARRPKATRDDLAEALDELLAGKKISVAETEADGCLLDHGTKPAAKNDVTYAKHVAPILQKNCQGCHRPEQSAPFALMNYDDAAKHAVMIKEVTAQRRMPPWHADPRFGHFANDRRLSQADIDTLTAWVDGGLARGDDKDLPAAVERPKGWVHGEPDAVFTMPEEFEVPAGGVLNYQNWIVDTKFTEDKWVTLAEAKPGNAAVVHHIVAYIQREGQKGPIGPDGSLSVLVGWAPGDLGVVCPPDAALRIPKGSQLRLEIHYTPNGKATKDRSSVGVTFAKKPPKFEVFIHEFANTSFQIPAKDPHFQAEATFRFRADARILSFAPHMHWRGQDYRYELITPDGKREPLLSVPRWDFNWQSVYRFEEPIKAPKGSRLHAVAHWDNSSSNLLNPDPSKNVRFGLQTWEEMMVGFVAYVWEREETAAELAKNPPTEAEILFDRFDANGDGVLTPDEIPERMRLFLQVSGVKIPEKITREEFPKFLDEMRKRFPRKPEPKKPDGDEKP
jgi:peroxiredoxin/mono/diheme cytochrome c family protein